MAAISAGSSATKAWSLRPDRAEAYADLITTITGLNDRGRLTPCQRDPHPFIGTDVPPPPEDRQAAAAACREACPALDACGAYDRGRETFGVWAGQWRSRSVPKVYPRRPDQPIGDDARQRP